MRLALPLLVGIGAALSGCAVGMAASAVGAAVNASSPRRVNVSEDLRPSAIAACSNHAAQYGQVRIIDSPQRPDGRVTVWGTVEDDRGRRSFECRYDGKVTAFKLRSIGKR